MFDSTVELFNKYYDKMEAEKPPNLNEALALEVQKRLEQLNYLYNNIKKKELRHIELQWKRTGDPFSLRERALQAGGSLRIPVPEELRREMDELIFEIELFTESF